LFLKEPHLNGGSENQPQNQPPVVADPPVPDAEVAEDVPTPVKELPATAAAVVVSSASQSPVPVISNKTLAVEKPLELELVTVSNERTTYANLFKTASTGLKPASAVAGSPKLPPAGFGKAGGVAAAAASHPISPASPAAPKEAFQQKTFQGRGARGGGNVGGRADVAGGRTDRYKYVSIA
jgi:hypothetical protein